MTADIIPIRILFSPSVLSDSAIPWTITRQAPLSMGFPSKNTRVGCHVLLQGFFPTQVSNPLLLCLLHWQAGSLPLVLPGKLFCCYTVTNKRRNRNWVFSDYKLYKVSVKPSSAWSFSKINQLTGYTRFSMD